MVDRKDQLGFGIGNIPGRKSKCLYLVTAGQVTPLAYFISDSTADFFLDCEPRLLKLDEAMEKHWSERMEQIR